MAADKHKKRPPRKGGGRMTPRLVEEPNEPPPQRIVRPCVLLAPASGTLPDALHAALAAEGLTPRMEHDPEMPMAELCLLRREQRQRPQGDAPQAPAPLVLAAPPLDRTIAMLDALARHVPDIPVLQFNGTSLCTHRAAEVSADPPVVAHPPASAEVSEAELSTLLSNAPQNPASDPT